MTIFYIFMSIIFGLFTYFVTTENEAGTKKSILLGLFMLICWPIVMVATTIYLIVMHCNHKKAFKENDTVLEATGDELKTEIIEDAGEWTELENTEETNEKEL